MNEDCIRLLVKFLTPVERARCGFIGFCEVPPFNIESTHPKEWEMMIPRSEMHGKWGQYISEMAAQCDYKLASRYRREIQWIRDLDLSAAFNGDDRYVRYILRLNRGDALPIALVEVGRERLIPRRVFKDTYTRLDIETGFHGRAKVLQDDEDFDLGTLLAGGVPVDVTRRVYELAAQLDRLDVVSCSVRHWDVSTFLVEGKSVKTAGWLVQNGRFVDGEAREKLGV